MDEKPVAVDNSFFTWPEFGPRRTRNPNPMALEIPKAKDALRIFILGGSAAQGDPDPSFSISRFLQCFFESTFPETRVEIYNSAMTAVDSTLVARAAEDLVELDPDLVVVYMGNNEFIGPSGLVAGEGLSRTMLDIKRSLLHLRTAGALADWKWNRMAEQGKLDDWEGMETFVGLEIETSDPRVDRVHRRFRTNLHRIVRFAGRRKIPVLLCTVGVNLSACPPLENSENYPEEIQAILRHLDELEKTGHLKKALSVAESARNSENALIEYRRGRILRAMALGQAGAADKMAAAAEAYQKARDFDRLRVRADSDINRSIRQEATTSEMVFLADIEKALEEISPIPGSDLFYDHVHFNFAGTYVAAQEVFETIREKIPDLLPAVEHDVLPDRKSCARRLGFSGWSLLKINTELEERFSRPPFATQFEHRLQISRLRSSSRHLETYRNPAMADGVRRLMIDELEAHPDDWILHYDLGLLLADLGHFDGAAVKMETVLKLRPTFDRARRALARVYLRLGRSKEAQPLLADLLTRHPYSVESLTDYGIALLSEKDPAAGEAFHPPRMKRLPDY